VSLSGQGYIGRLSVSKLKTFNTRHPWYSLMSLGHLREDHGHQGMYSVGRFADGKDSAGMTKYAANEREVGFNGCLTDN